MPLGLGQHPNVLVSKLLFDQQNKVPVKLPMQRASVILYVSVCIEEMCVLGVGGEGGAVVVTGDRRSMFCQNQED